ncbi:MAG: ribosome maturation factor RimM [Pantoea sp. Brub]|nr:ribosome maturation factor RimM [Pantoea sp. Brub]
MINKYFKSVPIDPIVIGIIRSAYGIFGWVKVTSFTEKIENIFLYQPWFIYNSFKWKKIEFNKWKYQYKDIIVNIKNISDRTAATKLANSKIIINSSQLLPIEEDNFYLKDLIGCQVLNTKGYKMGVVIDFIETSIHYVMIIKTKINNKLNFQERLIPFINTNVVQEVNLSDKIIKVNWDPDF